MPEELITPFPCSKDALGTEGAADALLGERRWIDCVMKKPRSVVVPEMVVRIRFADAKRGEGDEVGRHDA